MTNIPSSLILPSLDNWGLKNPAFSHQSYQDDSTAAGLYFSNAPRSRSCSTTLQRGTETTGPFFSPGTVLSMNVMSLASASFFFFSAFFDSVPGVAAKAFYCIQYAFRLRSYLFIFLCLEFCNFGSLLGFFLYYQRLTQFG